jgi:hypothetical protein
MNMQEVVKSTGEVSIKIFDAAGKLKEKIFVPNLVVQSGRDWIVSRMGSDTPVLMSHMAIGSDATATSTSQTTLISELGRTVLGSSVVVDNTITYTSAFAPGVGTGSIVEAGIFNDVTAGTMLCRTVFGVVTKDAADTMTISWTITVS